MHCQVEGDESRIVSKDCQRGQEWLSSTKTWDHDLYIKH